MNALVVCEDIDEAAILSFILQRIGYSVEPTTDLDKALRNWGESPAELIILAPHQELRARAGPPGSAHDRRPAGGGLGAST